jgi:hypothetical protein
MRQLRKSYAKEKIRFLLADTYDNKLAQGLSPLLSKENVSLDHHIYLAMLYERRMYVKYFTSAFANKL